MTDLFSLARRAPAGSPRVVLVHGLLDRCSSFTRVAGLLHDTSVTLYDRSGYGRSNQGRGPVGIDQHVDDLLAIIGDEPSVVVGHSFGGVVALAAACADPRRIRSVGAFEAPLLWMPWWPKKDLDLPVPGPSVEAFVRALVGDSAWDALRPGRRALLEAEAGALHRDRRVLDSEAFRLTDLSVPVLAGAAIASPTHLRAGMRRFARAHPLVAFCQVGRNAQPPWRDRLDVPSHNAHATHPSAFAVYIRRCLALADGAEHRRAPTAAAAEPPQLVGRT